MPEGPSRNAPPSRSSSEPNTAGESNRGTHSQSTEPSGATSAPVWQFDRNPYSAIGVNGEGAAALCASVAGVCSGAGLLPFPLVLARLVGALVTAPTDRAGGGRLRPRPASVWVGGRHLAVRRAPGAPDPRQLSTSSFSAAYVSVVESGATPSMSRYPSYCPRT